MAILEITKMSFWKSVKEELFRIAHIKKPEIALEEIKKLNQKVNGPKIQHRIGNYVYFYVMKPVYRPSVREGRREITEKLGKISREKYESNKNKINQMSREELKNYLEEY